MVIEDTDGDGHADTSRAFVQEPHLMAPLGIAVLRRAGLGNGEPGWFFHYLIS